MDFKGFMQKMTSSSSGKFKGQGRVLGSSTSSSGPTSGSPYVNPHRNPNQNQSPTSVSSSNLRALPQKTSDPQPRVNRTTSFPTNNSNALPEKASISSNPPPKVKRTSSFEVQKAPKSTPNGSNSDGFDPFDSLITTGKRNKNGYSLNVFECPVCHCGFASEEEVSLHIESCIDNPNSRNENRDDFGVNMGSVDGTQNETEPTNRLETCVGTYLSGSPSEGSVEIVLRLLRNIVKEPENDKFRKIRMSNPKIRETIGEVAGGVELVESVGFVLKEEGGEMWAFMAIPSKKSILMIEKAIILLEPRKNVEPSLSGASTGLEKVEAEKVEPEKVESKESEVIDRQIKVFYAVSERVAARIELPESFYNLSLEEAKREAEMRRKKIAESQLLIPKSYKEKQAQAVKRKHTRTIIRVHFPDGVVLQGVFSPREPTSAVYEFVSSALKQQGMEFELIHPVPVKRRVIPCFPTDGERQSTLADEDLVPSALVKFKPIDTDEDVVFIGLANELLQMSEPLGGNTS